MTQVHILNPFDNPFGGSEQRALELHALLLPHAEVTLWAAEPPHDFFRRRWPIRTIDADSGSLPQGGTVVIVGPYFPAERVFRLLRPRRLIYVYNTPSPNLFRRRLELARALTGVEPEIVYASPEGARQIGLPGRVEASPIDLQRFHPAWRPAARREQDGFVVGRLSRDVPEKHHPGDIALYRQALERGWSLRMMGATCLAGPMGAALYQRIASLPCGAVPPEDFLAGLDCFYYRVSDGWEEAFGRVILEAMASGLPVVCDGKVGAAKLITNGEDGFVIDSSEAAWAALARLSDDAALRARVGAAARRRAEAVYSEAYAGELVAYYLR